MQDDLRKTPPDIAGTLGLGAKTGGRGRLWRWLGWCKIDPLLGLAPNRFEKVADGHFGHITPGRGQLKGALVDGNGSHHNFCALQNRLADPQLIGAQGEIHHRIGAVFLGGAEFFQFLIQI